MNLSTDHSLVQNRESRYKCMYSHLPKRATWESEAQYDGFVASGDGTSQTDPGLTVVSNEQTSLATHDFRPALRSILTPREAKAIHRNNAKTVPRVPTCVSKSTHIGRGLTGRSKHCFGIRHPHSSSLTGKAAKSHQHKWLGKSRVCVMQRVRHTKQFWNAWHCRAQPPIV